LREAKEELGIMVTELEFIASLKDLDKTSGKLYLLHYFLCKKWFGKISKTTEQEDLQWQLIKQLKKLKMADVDRKAIRLALETEKKQKQKRN